MTHFSWAKENRVKQSVLEEATLNSSIKSASHAQELAPLLSMFPKGVCIFTRKYARSGCLAHAVTQRR